MPALSAGMRREELLTQAAAVFGSQSAAAAAPVTAVLEKALTTAIDRGRVTEQANGLLTP